MGFVKAVKYKKRRDNVGRGVLSLTYDLFKKC